MKESRHSADLQQYLAKFGTVGVGCGQGTRSIELCSQQHVKDGNPETPVVMPFAVASVILKNSSGWSLDPNKGNSSSDVTTMACAAANAIFQAAP